MSVVNIVSSVGGSAIITLPAVANTYYNLNRAIIINGGITSDVNETVTITLSGIALATGQINAIYETYTV